MSNFLLIIFFAVRAIDALLFHVRVAMYVRVREGATFHKKDAHAQQQHSYQ